MADRKPFIRRATVNEGLMKRIAESRKTPLTEEVLQEQRVSFAYGNALSPDATSKDSVRNSSNHIRLLS
jgi:hypothetical protein